MTTALIYQPTKTAMQSGRGKTQSWVLEYRPETATFSDPLMGWNGSHDTLRQVKLSFKSKEEALAFAEQKGIAYKVKEPKSRKILPKRYDANFANNRKLSNTFSNN